jgi:hypothetical protein
VSTASLTEGRSYRFVEEEPLAAGRRRWMGFQGSGVPVEGGEIRLSRDVPMRIESSGWVERLERGK